MPKKIYLLNNLEYDGVENLEVFGIEYLPSKININKYDALIFTSKNAIYSIDSFNKDWRDIDSYAIAPKTANVIEKHDGKLVFTGVSSHGDNFAQELIPLLKDKKVLYIRASKTVSDLTEILKNNNVDIEELIAYKTSCKKVDKKLEDNSIFVFTSPSSVQCFFKNYDWNESYYAVCIGNTTAKYLPSEIKYKISSKTSIEECIKVAQELQI
ncbi:uroporphyrinogen-III synthase [Poseidonibacter lekithochrous]|uniref:uroporphyrinogen-III synthase n=1 Tax=Poseidonibacter lekithochrous TaxID=1904463 RepID=UPI000D3A0578|nr:uroporphyrinogen-III synthase [Poseidonibacter lekithochrous]